MFDLVRWLRCEALPLWGDVGFDRRSGLFQEQLDLHARPLEAAPRRLMVQARQIHVFAVAELMGLFPGGSLAEQAGDTVLRLYTEDGGRDGFAFSVARDGALLDAERDLYAQAFALFALAWLGRLTGGRRFLDVADATLAFLDARMARPGTGGYAEVLFGQRSCRRQNPHMHLVEALLALHEAEPDRGYLARADRLISLLPRRFLQGSKPVLVETFDEHWRPLVGPPFCFEPGHHLEWAWLLAEHARLGGQPPPPLARDLVDSAILVASAEGAIVDLADDAGQVRAASMRLWPHAEAVRATSLDLGPPRDRPSSPQYFLNALERLFLRGVPNGCWMDRLDARGQPQSTVVPASSLYHLIGAARAMAST